MGVFRGFESRRSRSTHPPAAPRVEPAGVRTYFGSVSPALFVQLSHLCPQAGGHSPKRAVVGSASLAEGSSLPWHLPVMQAPIGPATTWELVAAVSAVGGLGTLAASWTELAELRGQIGRIVSATANPFCVNLVLAFDQRDRLELLLECGVPVVSFSWGIDAALIGRARRAGLTVLVQVADEYEAKSAAAAGADVLIAQGVEAGGHVQGSTPLLRLVRKIRAAVALPIVAAGGIADAVAARTTIAAGAQAVACGSAFLAASEADVNPRYSLGSSQLRPRIPR